MKSADLLAAREDERDWIPPCDGAVRAPLALIHRSRKFRDFGFASGFVVVLVILVIAGCL